MTESYVIKTPEAEAQAPQPQTADDAARLAVEGSKQQPEANQPPTEDQAENIANEAGLDVGAIETHWIEHGSLPETELTKLEQLGISREDAEAYIAYRYEQSQNANNDLIESVGGEETFSQMSQWATTSWDAAQLEAYNKAVDSGDRGQIQLALSALKSAYLAANPPAPPKPKLVSAPNAGTGGGVQPYRSLAEAQRDFSNPLYQKDPAFRSEVERVEWRHF